MISLVVCECRRRSAGAGAGQDHRSQDWGPHSFLAQSHLFIKTLFDQAAAKKIILLERIKIWNMTVVSDSVLCVVKLTVTCLPKTNWGISSLLMYNKAKYEHAALWDCAEFNWSFGPVWKAKGWRQQVKRPNDVIKCLLFNTFWYQGCSNQSGSKP